MISKWTLFLLSLPVRLCSLNPFVTCLPYEWKVDKKKGPRSTKLIKSKRFPLYILCTVGVIIYKAVVIFKMANYFTKCSPNDYKRELLPSAHLGFVFLLSSWLEIHLFMNYKALMVQIKYDLTLWLRTDINTRIATIIMLVVIGSITFGGFLLIAGGFYLLEAGHLFQMFRMPSAAGNALLILLLCYVLQFDTIVLVFYLFFSLVYFLVTLKSLQRFEWKSPTTLEVRKQLELRYRYFYILNYNAQNIFAFPTFQLFGGGVFLMIAAFYSVIRFHETLSPPFIIVMGIEGLFFTNCLGVVISFSIQIREACLTYPYSFIKFEKGLLLCEKKFFKSCYPLEMNVGNLFPLTTRVFFLVVMHFVLENVVNLLVTK